jgi:hypothetical protein
MNDQSPWPGPLSLSLDELTAFDAMRAFLEAYWERGGRASDDIAVLLGMLDRSIWADGGPGDPAQWRDWKAAICRVSRSPRDGSRDPLT